jgi:hypothetical protein
VEDDSGEHGFEGSKAQRLKGSKAQRFKGSKVQRFKGSKAQRLKGIRLKGSKESGSPFEPLSLEAFEPIPGTP